MSITEGDQKEQPESKRLENFERTYASLHQAVYANIFRVVRNPVVAEDILQDVFLTYWENMWRLDTDRTPNWLFVVSFNKSLTYVKKTARIGLEDYPEHLDEPADLPETDEIAFEERLTLVYEAIEFLPERKREIFKQYRMEGKAAEQIAVEMHLSVHTVKDHLKVANRLIRDRFAQKTALKAGTELALFVALLTY